MAPEEPRRKLIAFSQATLISRDILARELVI